MSHLITQNLPFTTRCGWTVSEFERLFEAGFLDFDVKMELIEGDIWKKPFQEPADATAAASALYKLKNVFSPAHSVRVQLPLLLGEASKLEPDLAIVTGTPRDYLAAHPSSAELVIEISDSTLVQDQTTKAALYARAQIAEYWIVNLVDRTLEVRRQPSPIEGALLGWGYRFTQILLPGERVEPLAGRGHVVGVDELLP